MNKVLMPMLAAGLLAGLSGCASEKQIGSTALEKGHEYMVLANRPSQLHVIDLATNELYKSCDVPGDYGPGTLQVAPDHQTVFILTEHYDTIYAIDMDTCAVTFSADMAQAPNERAKTLYSMALSPDGSELYAIQTPTLLFSDHYEAQEPRLAVYDTSAGMKARPVRTFPVPRQISVMQTSADGTLYMAVPIFTKWM